MSLAKALKKQLPAELYTQVMDAMGDDFDWDVVPRTRLNTVIQQRNELQEQLGMRTPAKGAGGDPDPEPSPVPPKSEDRTVEIEAQYKKQLTQMERKYRVLDKLRAAGAVDAELIVNAGLIQLEGEEELDLDAAVKTLVEDKARSYLFNPPQPKAGTGKEGQVVQGGSVTAEQFKAMGYAERLELKTNNPTAYSQLTKGVK